MGYSVVLWTIPEQQIKSGDIVPVYIKSNISHVYVIGTQGGENIPVAAGTYNVFFNDILGTYNFVAVK